VSSGVLFDEQSAHLLGELEVVGIGNFVHRRGVADGVPVDIFSEDQPAHVDADIAAGYAGAS